MERSLRTIGFFLLFLGCVGIAPVLATDYYVSAINGSDVTGDGTQGNPLKSLTYAINNLAFGYGDILHAGPGVYDAANGEGYPIIVPFGVTLLGDDPRFVIIDGGGPGSSSWSVVRLSESAAIQKVTITGSTDGWWDGGLYLGWGTTGAHAALVEDCIITGNERGVWGFELDTILVRNCMFANNRNDAVSFFDSIDLTIINNSFYGNLKGVILAGNAGSAGEIWNNVISTSGQAGIETNSSDWVIADYNCVWNCNPNYSGISPGTHDINVDPIIPFGGWNDLHLASFSPCIDNADPGHSEAPDFDMFGKDRNTGAGMDRGAVEAVYRECYAMGLPHAGEVITINLIGRPADWWLLLVSPYTGSYSTPYGQMLVGIPFWILGSGTMGGPGAIGLQATMPPGLAGLTAYFQAIIGTQFSNRYDMAIF
ncbi:MAG: right-handed parallel beta-helix repeat-containing protein [Planctomycetota bacterium]